MQPDETDQDLEEIQQYGIRYSDKMLAKQEAKFVDHFGLWIVFVSVFALTLGAVFEWLRRRV